MANDYAFVTNNERPTLRERVNALAQHRPLYGSIDKHPQSGIYNRFGENWPMVLYYVEGEVHRCKDAVDVFIFKQAQSLTEAELETGLAMVMEKLMSAQFLHGMFPLFYFCLSRFIDDDHREGSEGDERDGLGTSAYEGVYGRLSS
jgi:hypothetical protein